MNILSKTYYHGSPSDFDKFDMKFLSSGVGDQVWGWGIYVAENRSTSENYNKAFNLHKTDWNRISFGGHDYELYERGERGSSNTWSMDGEILGGLWDDDEGEWIDYHGDKDIDSINTTLDFIRSLQYDKELIKDVYVGDYPNVDWDLVQEFLDDESENENKFHSVLYTLDVDDYVPMIDNSVSMKDLNQWSYDACENVYNEMLNLMERNIDEFGSKVYAERRREMIENFRNMGWEGFVSIHGNIKGFEFYKFVAKAVHMGLDGPFTEEKGKRYEELGIHVSEKGAQQDASLLLSRCGIKGMKYYGKKDGYCAVIYDPDVITIVSKERS